MRYLRNSDYRHKITSEDLSIISEDSDAFIVDSELTAQAKIQLSLRKRYDLRQLFTTYSYYTTGTTYYSGDTVWYSSNSGTTEYLYAVAVSATTESPDMNHWKVHDPRYRIITDWMVTFTLYRLHEKIAPENIPVHRKDAYDEAVKTLKMIQEGKLSPDFPEIENRVNSVSISGACGDSFVY